MKKYFPRLITTAVLLFVLFLQSVSLQSLAQTTLTQGDISIVGFNANPTKGVAFVTWVNLSAGTQIRFTDCGFISGGPSTASNNIRWLETVLVWTATSALPAGTVVKIDGEVASTGTADAMNVDGTTAGVTALGIANNTGDQFFAYQGANMPSTPTPSGSPGTFNNSILFGVGYQGSAGTFTSWLTSGTTTTASSYRPSDLAAGNTVYFAGNATGAEFKASLKSGSANAAAYKTLIADIANWTPITTGAMIAFNTTSFSLGTPPVVTAQPSNATICSSNNTSFSITATGTSLTYEWQVSTTGSGGTFSPVTSNGGLYTNFTTPTLTINAATTGMNGYAYKCVVTGAASPAATSNAALLAVNASVTYYRDADGDGYGNAGLPSTTCTGAPTGFVNNGADCDDGNGDVFPGQSVWIGAANTLWSNPANWSCGILPDATTNVIINSSSNMPVVNITTAVCYDLTIGIGASLTINSGMTLNIKGTTSNSGTFSAIGKTTFSGGGQVLPSGNYQDLELAGTGIKKLGGATTVSGILTITSSKFALDNYNLIISSTGSITGANAANYIVINGSGSLKQQGIGTGGRTGTVSFPIGTSAGYNPISIDNAGTADEFTARVVTGIYDSYNGIDAPTGTVQTTNNVNKTWTITETVAGGSDATLAFQWNASDELSGFTRTSCFPSHYTGSYWTRSAPRAADGSNPYQTSMTGVTSFSPFGIGSTNSVLPLTLISFKGKESVDGIALQWTTANEINTAGFEIERAVKGGNFISVGGMPSNNTSSFGYTDKTAVAGSVYSYRLKLLDKDGSYSYSATISITYSASITTGFSVYPNPASGPYLYIKAPAGISSSVKLAVFDVAGKSWYKGQRTTADISNGRFEIPIKQLPAGSYVLKISDSSGRRLQTTKFNVRD